jgi:hypothetical protein
MTPSELTPKKLLSLLREAEGMKDKDEALRRLRLLLQDNVDAEKPIDHPKLATDLHERFNALIAKNVFSAGKLVQWKPNLKNRRRPAYGEPAVVVSVLPEPVAGEKDDPSTPFFREPLDLVLGLLDEDGDFLCYHFDSRRFEPYQPKS